jgi:hypothetical protein
MPRWVLIVVLVGSLVLAGMHVVLGIRRGNKVRQIFDRALPASFPLIFSTSRLMRPTKWNEIFFVVAMLARIVGFLSSALRSDQSDGKK